MVNGLMVDMRVTDIFLHMSIEKDEVGCDVVMSGRVQGEEEDCYSSTMTLKTVGEATESTLKDLAQKVLEEVMPRGSRE